VPGFRRGPGAKARLGRLKLLFDANISSKLVERLADLFPESSHVRLAGLERASDETVWSHALENGLVIVSKDEDFHQMALLTGPPPKFVWVRLGNCSTDDIERALREQRGTLEEFGADQEASFLVLDRR